jgi:hypothetical protein
LNKKLPVKDTALGYKAHASYGAIPSGGGRKAFFGKKRLLLEIN